MNVQDLAWHGGATPAQYVAKGIDDVLWTSTGGSINDLGNISLKAARQSEKSLDPSECYELSIAVNAAVNSIGRNISKAKIRLFNRGGEEIVGGQLFDLFRRPAPKLSGRGMLEELVSWYNIAGEYLLGIHTVGDAKFPNRLTPLNPFQAFIQQPKLPKTSNDIVQWRYVWADGSTEYIRADFVVHGGMFNPNVQSVRGLSPLVTGAVMVSGQHAAEKFNKAFFDNSAIPSHIIAVQGNMPRKQREDFERRYLAEHSTYGNNAHKVLVVSGADEVKVVPIEQPFDGAFLDTQKHADFKIGQLYRVPAIEMGIYDKTRFDTAAEERKLFLESTLLPQIEKITEALQFQLVDPHFQFSQFSVTRPRLNKSMDAALEKARYDRPDSNIVVVIDPDSMPIMGDVQLARMDYAEKLKSNFHMSPQEAADWLHLDIEDRPERMDVWIDRKFMNVTHPELNAQLQPGMTGQGTNGAKPAAKKKPAKKELSDADRERIKVADKLIRKLRIHTIKTIDDGLWSLADADAITEDAFKEGVRTVRHGLRMVTKDAPDKREAAKVYFNTLDTKAALGLVHAGVGEGETPADESGDH